MGSNRISCFSGGRVLVFAAALVLLCNYYYLYFVDFNQGAASVGWFFSAFKILGVVLAIFALLCFSLKDVFFGGELACLIFFLMASLLFVMKGLLWGFNDRMFLNALLCAVPFFIFRFKGGRERVRFFFECCLLVVTFQIFLDQFIAWSGVSLWENKAFVGGVGNPSSFGLLCNLLLCYVFFERRLCSSSALFAFVLAYGACRTSSLLALISLVVVLFFCFFERRSLKRLAYVLAVFFFSVYYGGQAHLFYKVGSLAGLVHEGSSSGAAGGSISVSARLGIHYEYFYNLLSYPFDALFYGFTGKGYMAYDSQLLSYFSSFGLLFSLLFFGAFSLALFRCLFGRIDYFIFVSLFIFGLAFLTNRVLDYYPMPIFFAIFMSLASKRFLSEDQLNLLWLWPFPFFCKKSEGLSS